MFAVVWKAIGGSGSVRMNDHYRLESIHSHSISGLEDRQAIYALQPDYSVKEVVLDPKSVENILEILEGDSAGRKLADYQNWKDDVEAGLHVINRPGIEGK